MDLIKKMTKDPIHLSLLALAISGILFIGISLFDFLITNRMINSTQKDVSSILEKVEKDFNVYLEQKKETLTNFISYLEKNQLIDLLDTPTYSNIYLQTQHQIEKGLSTKEFTDISQITIISALNNIIYTTNPQLIYGAQFNASFYEQNTFVQAFLRSKMSSKLDTMVLHDNQQVALLLTMPIFSHKGYKGAVQVTLKNQNLFEKLKQTLSAYKDYQLVFLVQTKEELRLISFDTSTLDINLEKTTQLFNDKYPFAQASEGKKGSAITSDWNEHKIIASWDYFPSFNIGLMIYKDYQTALKSIIVISIFWYICLLFFIVSIIATVLLAIQLNLFPFILMRKVILLTSLTIILTTLLLLIYNLFLLSDKSRFTLHNKAKSELENAVQQINLYVYSIESLANLLAIDLQTNQYSQEELDKKLKNILNNNSAINTITIAYKKFGYDSTIPFFSPKFTKTMQGITKKQFSSVIDYSAPESKLDPRYNWYQKSLELGSYWSTPYVNENNQLEYIYSAPFNNKDNSFNGVIAIGFNLLEITKKINFIIGKHGYSFIIAPNGRLIYHPKIEDVIKQKTIFEVSSESNSHLSPLVKRMLSKEIPPISLQPLGIHGYYATIPITHWIMGTIIFEKDARPDTISYLHTVIWTITLSTILAIIITIISCLILFDTKARYFITIFSTIILFISVVCISYFARLYSLEKSGIVPITDNLSLDRQLNQIEQHAIAQNKLLPIKIETGIFIYDFSMKDYGTLSINAYVWQKYHEILHKDIPRQLTFPQAYKLKMSEVFRKKEHENEVIGWNVSASVPIESSFDKYPLDTTIVSIVLAHPDLTKNILLIPDLSSYEKPLTLVNPTSENQVYSSGFYLKDNFFSYQKDVPETTYGVPEIQDQVNDTFFATNMILIRKIANPLTLYITPMLVVFLSIFGILYMMRDKMLEWDKLFSAVGSYSATFFSILFIHRSLREAYPVAETLYLEYLFFIAYWVLFILTVRTIFPLLDRIKFAGVDQKILTLLYWPMLLTIWYIITLIKFYNGSI